MCIKRMVKYLMIYASYLMKCIYKNLRGILEVSWLVSTRTESYIKEFMIVWLTESVPYVIKSSPEITINAAWHRCELFECLDVLYQCDFNVRAIVCDKYQSNTSTQKKLLERCNENPDDLCMRYQWKKPLLRFSTSY